jgi:hypothetical protein
MAPGMREGQKQAWEGQENLVAWRESQVYACVMDRQHVDLCTSSSASGLRMMPPKGPCRAHAEYHSASDTLSAGTTHHPVGHTCACCAAWGCTIKETGVACGLYWAWSSGCSGGAAVLLGAGRASCIRRLVQSDRQLVDAVHDGWDTPLMLAVTGGHAEVVR